MRLSDLGFAYGDKVIFDHLHLTLEEGAITAVLGDSGVGKTTLLHLLAGIVPPDYGRIDKRNVGYMFQEPRLLPTLDVLHNLLAVPSIDEAGAKRWLEAVGLGDSLKLLPHQLSGGMAQRVSMARAFAAECDLLLMDEPFRGLDLSLQAKLHEVFAALWREANTTTVMVTHDVDEAVALAGRVLVLRGSPASVVYDGTVADKEVARAAVRAALTSPVPILR